MAESPELRLQPTSPAAGATLDAPGRGEMVTVYADVAYKGVFHDSLLVTVTVTQDGLEWPTTASLNMDQRAPPWTSGTAWAPVRFGKPGPATIHFRAHATAVAESRLITLEAPPVTVNVQDHNPLALKVIRPFPLYPVRDTGEEGWFYIEIREPAHVQRAESTLDDWASTYALQRYPRDPVPWSAKLPLSKDIRSYVAKFRCFDHFNRETSIDAPFQTVDETRPRIFVGAPTEDQVIIPDKLPFKSKVEGRAEDLQTGIQSISWSLDGRSFSPIDLSSTGDFSFPIEVPEYGLYTLSMRARDGSAHQQEPERRGNPVLFERQFELVSTYKPKTLDDMLGPRAYLDELLRFINAYFRQPGDTAVGTNALTELLFQPFGRLRELASAQVGDEPVSRLRVPVETLRQYLATGPAPYLVAHWRCDDGAGDVLSDAGPSHSHGTLKDGAGWGIGRMSGAVTLDGTNSHVEIPHGTIGFELGKANADFSVTFWLNLTQNFTGNYRRIIQKGSLDFPEPEPERTFALFMCPDDNRIHFRISTTGPAENRNDGGDSTSEVQINTWTHIAYVKSGGNLKLYIDGRLDAVVVLKGETISNTGPIHIGRNTSWLEPTIKGGLDDLRIYAAALPEDAIAQLAQGRPDDALSSVSATEENYLQMAYETLLAQIGTSYAELRVARTAAPSDRVALAKRLGLDAAKPEQLASLLPPDAGLTEPWLENMFGLSDTARPDPLRPRPDQPQLLEWQLEALQARWREQDHPITPSDDQTPIVDPDLIDLRDLRHPATDDPVHVLLTRRARELDAWEQEIRAKVKAVGSPREAFATVTAFVLGADVALDALAAKDREGQSIAADLNTVRLSWAGFRRLLQVGAIAAKDEAITAAEWEDVCQILLQARKEQQYSAWAGQEQGILLSPDHFVWSDHEPVLRPWRSSAAARLAWRRKLQERIRARAALGPALRAAVAAAEETSFPLLRDALVRLLGDADTLPQVADQVSQRLLLDLGHSGVGSTTRVMQAHETLQQLVVAVRYGRLPSTHPASNWTYLGPGDELEDFDETWATIGRHADWQAAMRIFLYPENALLPELLPRYQLTTSHFLTLIDELQKNGQLPPERVTELAKTYSTNLKGDPDYVNRLHASLHELQLGGDFTSNELLQRKDVMETHKNEAGDRYLVREKFFFVPTLISRKLQRSGYYSDALGWLQTIYAWNLPLHQRKVFYMLEEEQNAAPDLKREEKRWARDRNLDPHEIANKRPNPLTRFVLTTISRCLIDYADSEFATDTSESVAAAQPLYLLACDLLRAPELDLIPPLSPEQALLPNPVVEALRTRVQAQVAKLRSGRNLAGMRRELELLTAPTAGWAPAAAARPSPPRPTPYRYSVLIERCKQLVAIAQQMEASYLVAIEKGEGEGEKLLVEGFAVEIGEATVQLQGLRQTQAHNSTELAHRQRERSSIAAARYKTWIDAGPNEYENKQIEKLWESQKWQNYAGVAQANEAASSYATGAALPWQWAAAGVASAFATARNVFQALAGEAATSAQVSAIRASQQRREDEWRLQQDLARQDALIGDQQIAVAKDQEAITDQEHLIATKQRDQARAMVDFLRNKFTSRELYEWLAGELRDVYGFFLQQATAMAQLAQTQLAFERSASPLGFIRRDYWKSSPQLGAASGGTDPTERRGLTGSARLLEDIHRLDQHAFETDRRRLNLVQTFSLAQLMPYEFALFKETGVLPFETPMRLFDERFPGQYMRLIKQVRTTLVALVPPTEGVRAVLSASGTSRVVVGPEVFTPVVLHRDPPQVSLTSPVAATGVFELDPQPDLLGHFEGMGVDTRWEFTLPKAANPFDYRSITNLLITIEYTALHSHDYREEVIRTLDPEIGGERTFSVRDNMSDTWYDLNNPDQAAAPWQIKFETTLSDFLPNLADGPTLREILVLVIAKDGTDPAEGDLALDYQPAGKPSGGPPLVARLSGGVVSTRRANGNAAWGEFVRTDKPAAGTWSLIVPDGTTDSAGNLRRKFRSGEIEDILVVLTFSGKRPPWPRQ